MIWNSESLKMQKEMKKKKLEEEVDPQYEGLYKKIDLYLEKISKFTDRKNIYCLIHLLKNMVVNIILQIL